MPIVVPPDVRRVESRHRELGAARRPVTLLNGIAMVRCGLADLVDAIPTDGELGFGKPRGWKTRRCAR
jgi:hypothetical protein